MISLGTTVEEMLLAIGSRTIDERRTDPDDPRLVHDEVASIVLRGAAPEEILPHLQRALLRRFAHLPRERLRNDLIGPLKKGVGNAYRRGNRKDRSKQITVRASITPLGAVFVVSDEGEGFDFEGVLARFRRDEQYFERMGSGFRRFHKARSLVSFADGGRTFLLRFLCEQEPGRPQELAGSPDLGRAGDEAFMLGALAAQVPFFRSGEQALLGCRVFVPEEDKREGWDVKYELCCRVRATGTGHVKVLTGQWAPPDAARKSLEVATELRHCIHGAVRVPEAVAVLDEPSLVLFAFNPEQDLRELLRRCEKPLEAAAFLSGVGTCLREVHASSLDLEVESLEQAFPQHRAVARRAVITLAEHEPDMALRIDAITRQLDQQVASLAATPAVPIHGHFGWDRIVQGDRHLYLVGFDHFRRGHPGFDLGAAVADLLRFYLLREKAHTAQLAKVRRALLDAYFAGRAPGWREDLPVFVAAALLLRLGRLLARPRKKWSGKLEPLVGLCEGILGAHRRSVRVRRTATG